MLTEDLGLMQSVTFVDLIRFMRYTGALSVNSTFVQTAMYQSKRSKNKKIITNFDTLQIFKRCLINYQLTLCLKKWSNNGFKEVHLKSKQVFSNSYICWVSSMLIYNPKLLKTQSGTNKVSLIKRVIWVVRCRWTTKTPKEFIGIIGYH